MKEMAKLTEQQQAIVDATENKVVVISGAAVGKAQPNDTIIPTPDGYKTIGELEKGDKVFNRFGEPETIIGVFPQGKKKVYKVTFQDKRETLCCEEHLWSYDNSHGGLTTKTLKEIYESGWVKKDSRGHNKYKYRIPNLLAPVDYEKKTYVINPYTMGCFIGNDGCLEKNLTISSSDEFIVQHIAEIEGFGYKKLYPNGCSWSFYELITEKPIRTKTFFSQYANKAACYYIQKRIPIQYLLGNIEQRLEFLRGLMDTNGIVGDDKNSPNYVTDNYELALDVAELCRSLGIFCSINGQCKRTSGKNIKYIVNIEIDRKKLSSIFKLPRKKEKAKDYEDGPRRMMHEFTSIYNIEPLDEEVEMTCIQVDHKEHLYLTNSFIVTHNTVTVTARAKKLLDMGIPSDEIAIITFTNAAAEELIGRIGDTKQMFVGTIHSLANKFLRSVGIETRSILDLEKFDNLFKMVEQNPHCIPHISYLICDEAQDSTKIQFKFMLDMIKPDNWMLVGDFRQSIYGFNGADPQYFIDLSKREDVTVYNLNQNYRNADSIYEFAREIISQNGIDYRDASKPMRGVKGQVYTLDYQPQAICRTIKKYKDEGRADYKDWFILVRTNDDIARVLRDMEKGGLPCETFKKAALGTEGLAQMLENDTIKILTVHTAKGLESKYVIVVNVGIRLGEVESNCLAYVAATRARDCLVWTFSKKTRKAPKTYQWGS